MSSRPEAGTQTELASMIWSIVIALLCLPGGALLLQQLGHGMASVFDNQALFGQFVDTASRLTGMSPALTLVAVALTIWQYSARSSYRHWNVIACFLAIGGLLFYWLLMGAFM